MTRPRFASWAAVSTLPQAKKISLEDQLALNRDHILRHGGELVAELVVPGESRNIVLFEDAARKMDAYARLHDLIKAKAIDVLIYLDRSRLGRQASLSMAVVALCTTNNIAVYEVENPPATLDAARLQSHDDMLLGAIKSVGAEREVRKLQERHKLGMIGRIKAGRPANKVVYGYRFEYDSAGSRSIVVDEPAAAVVRRIFALYLDGHGTPHIAAALNADRIPTPAGSTWQAINVRSILDNVRRYAGYTAVNRRSRNRPYTEAPAQWEPLIDADTLAAIEAERQRRRDQRRRVDTPYRLSGVVYCKTCLRPLHVRKFKKRAPHHQGSIQLVCLRCGGIAYRRVLAKLREKMVSLQGADLDELAGDALDPRDAIRSHITALMAQLGGLDNALERADSSYVRGTMTQERYERQVAKIQEESAALCAQIAHQEAALQIEDDRGSRRQRLEEVVSLGLAKLDDADETASNAWLRAHVRVYVDGRQVFAVDWI